VALPEAAITPKIHEGTLDSANVPWGVVWRLGAVAVAQLGPFERRRAFFFPFGVPAARAYAPNAQSRPGASGPAVRPRPADSRARAARFWARTDRS
jgi:hypothetical protein